jgi:hypothetical protein
MSSELLALWVGIIGSAAPSEKTGGKLNQHNQHLFLEFL